MLTFSRWQVFEHETGDIAICKHCHSMTEFDGEKAPDKLPIRCKDCGAIMLGRKCWFPKED